SGARSAWRPPATAQPAALRLGRAAPDTGLRPVVQCPAQADPFNRARAAHLLGRLNLRPARAHIGGWEEQVRVRVAACGVVKPGHGLAGEVYGGDGRRGTTGGGGVFAAWGPRRGGGPPPG